MRDIVNGILYLQPFQSSFSFKKSSKSPTFVFFLFHLEELGEKDRQGSFNQETGNTE
jgi:hypothetical protein